MRKDLPEEMAERKFHNPETGSEFTLDGIIDMVQAVLEKGRGLTKWEEGFISSVADWVDNTGGISENQLKVLERIYANKT